jgi:HSP20 family protein
MPNQSSSRDMPPAAAPSTQGGADAWSPLVSLRDEIDRLFDDFGAGFWRHPLARRLGPTTGLARDMPLSPVIELVDCDTEYCVTAELPGLTPEHVDIRLSDGMLTIRGEKSEETRDEKADCLLSERRYGAFQRSLRLPAGVDPEKITARLAQGVLSVTLPKTPEARQTDRKIEIKVA